MSPVEPMSAERLAEIEARNTAWFCENSDCNTRYAEYVNGCPRCSEYGLFFSVKRFMLPDFTDLIAEVKRLQAVEAELREFLGCFGVDDTGWQANEPRIKYFDAQVDKVDWVRIQAVMGKGEVK